VVSDHILDIMVFDGSTSRDRLTSEHLHENMQGLLVHKLLSVKEEPLLVLNLRLHIANLRRVRLGLAGWLGWPAPSYEHCLYESASSISLLHKRISNDTNQPTEQADES